MVAPHAGSVYVIFALVTIFAGMVAPLAQSKCSESKKDITALSGSTVHLPCLEYYNSSEPYTTVAVNWNKTKTLCHYRVTQNVTTNMSCSDRFQFMGHPHKLYLRDLQLSDSGVYRCSVARLIPPPAVDLYKHQLTIHVIDIVIGHQSSSNENCTQLWCMLVGLPNVEVNFTWSRERNGAQEVLQHEMHSTSLNSTLELCDGGSSNEDIFCRIRINSSNSISVFKQFKLPSRKGTGLCRQDLLMIIGLSVLGLAILLIISCIIYRRRARRRDTTMMYTNKVYENFNFTTPVPAPNSSEKHEHCIYEN